MRIITSSFIKLEDRKKGSVDAFPLPVAHYDCQYGPKPHNNSLYNTNTCDHKTAHLALQATHHIKVDLLQTNILSNSLP
ncbi:hypothetical protein RJT34_11232 [Clitoria ternatea]|uniref:Uncharacterized protein n=1 Tax=Clitoria ternatea TaxID=43366 RepID=A0AAN9JMB3_CLITE